MKKIVGILAAAAVLATSVFAADVSAKVKLDGKLLNVDTTKEKDGVSAVSIGHNTDESWNPVLNTAHMTGSQIWHFLIQKIKLVLKLLSKH